MAGTLELRTERKEATEPSLGQRAVVDATSADPLQVARANEYLLLASLIRSPPTARLLSELAALKGDASPIGLAHLALADAARSTTVEAAASEYFALFIGVGRGELLPYASYYLTGFLHERPLARVRADMARLGFSRQDKVFEPEDHLVSLLEVVAGLIGGGTHDDETGASSQDDADRFLQQHVLPWAPRFWADLRVAPSAKFYTSVAALGALWLEIEAEALRLEDGAAE